MDKKESLVVEILSSREATPEEKAELDTMQVCRRFVGSGEYCKRCEYLEVVHPEIT